MINDLSREDLLMLAQAKLRDAIEILDRALAPGQIAAHVDLGLCQLDELIESAVEVGCPS